jgi:hypothetical protein
VTDNDRIVLSAAFPGGNFAQLIEKFVQAQLQNLINSSGQALSNADLEAKLLSLVNSLLPTPVSAFAPFIDAIIKRIIHNAVQNRGNVPGTTPTTPPSLPPIPLNPSGGAQSFDISGRITFTPVSGTTPPPNGNGPPNGGGTPSSIINNPLNETTPAPRPVR